MRTYRLHIVDSYTPDTIPMVRLGEYLAEFGRVLGEVERVHFERIKDGSVTAVAVVEAPAQPRVRDRLMALSIGNAPDDARKAWHRIDDMLAKDNAAGSILDEDDNKVIEFPGRFRPQPRTYGPFAQEGVLEGEIVRIGGVDESVHVALRDGDTVHSGCVVSKNLARQLAPHLFAGIVRLHGTGKWVRHPDGKWEMKSFRIKSFEALRDTPLDEVVNRLRAIGGNDWADSPDPVGDILAERGDGPSVRH